MDAIILAAGAGARVGGPKARLLYAGAPLALVHVRHARALGARRVVVVARPDDVGWIAAEAEAVASSAPDPAGSLGVGARRLVAADGAQGSGSLVLVVPVDTLPVDPAAYARLAAALLEGGVEAAVPVHGGRGGHPVLVRPATLAPFLREAPPPLVDVLRALGPRCVRVPTESPGVTDDLDTPEDVLRLTGAPPRFLGSASG